MAQFWDRAHTEHIRVWITGSSSNDVWTRLDQTGRIKQGLRVLNIGVGEGHDTRDLAGAGCQVDVLDISPLALRKVAEITRGWLSRTQETCRETITTSQSRTWSPST